MRNIQSGFRMPAGMMVCRLVIIFTILFALTANGWGLSVLRKPLSAVINESDLVVHGVVESVKVTPRQGPPLSKTTFGTVATLHVKLRVLNSVPAIKSSSIEFVGDGQPTQYKIGQMLIICLKRAGAEFHPIESLPPQGVYPFHQSNGTTVTSFGSPGFVLVGQDAAWQHVIAMHDEVSGKYADTTKTLARVEKLKNGSLRSVAPSPATDRKDEYFWLRPPDWVRDDVTSVPMSALKPGKHRISVRLPLDQNSSAISNQVVIGINPLPEPPSPDSVTSSAPTSARRREITEWFDHFAHGEHGYTQPPAKPNEIHKVTYTSGFGIPGGDLAWSDIPILLDLAGDSSLLNAGKHSLPSAPDFYVQREARAGMIALWLVELIRRQDLKDERLTPTNPFCLKGDLKAGECEKSEPIHREALAAYLDWWSKVKLLPPAESKKIDPLAWTDLNWFGAKDTGRVISSWGKPDGGVQVRLAAGKGFLSRQEIPKLLAEVRNTGEHKYDFTPNSIFFEIEYDGQWYSISKILYTGTNYDVFSKHETPIPIPVELKANYRRIADGAPLLLAGGRHTIRVAIPINPSPKDPSAAKIRPVSEPISLGWAGKQ